MIKEGIAKRLKRIREERGRTQQEVADFVGASDRSVVANWEKGKTKPKQQYLEKYADYFDVSMDWIKYGGLSDFAENVISNQLAYFDIFKEDKLTSLQKAVYEYSKRCMHIDKYSYLQNNPDKGFALSTDLGSLAYDVGSFFLFGYTSNELNISLNGDYLDAGYSEAYEYFYNQIGYNEDTLIQETIKLFKTDLRELKKINRYLDDEVNIKAEAERYNLSEDLPFISPPEPKILEEYKTHPNITNLINKLERMQQNNSEDISDAIYEAIDKLLN